jgi:hypothetical protein
VPKFLSSLVVVVVAAVLGVMEALAAVVLVVLFITQEDLFRQALHIPFKLVLVVLVPMVQMDRILL